MTKATIGYAMCGSFCTFSQAFEQMQKLVDSGYRVLPIMSTPTQQILDLARQRKWLKLARI